MAYLYPMKVSNSLKGYLFALLSVIAVSNVYIFSKAALSQVSFQQFGTYWFAFGLLWILLFAYYRKSLQVFKDLKRRSYVILFALALFDVTGTFFFFKAIHTVSNPSIVSFIGNISPVLVITLSFFILGEKFNRWEFAGMLLVLLGAFVISYKGNGIHDMFIDGTQYVFISSALGAFNAVVIKRNIKEIPPVVLTLSRTFFLLLFSVISLLVMGEHIQIPEKALHNILIGSVLGPFLTVIAGYWAIQYIPLSRKAIVGSLKGLFVLLGAYLYFGKFPRILAIVGGAISIVGVLLIAYGKLRLQKKTKKS